MSVWRRRQRRQPRWREGRDGRRWVWGSGFLNAVAVHRVHRVIAVGFGRQRRESRWRSAARP